MSDISQTLMESLVWTIKEAVDQVSIGLTQTTSMPHSAAANILVELNG